MAVPEICPACKDKSSRARELGLEKGLRPSWHFQMCCFLGMLQPLVPEGLPGGPCDSPPPLPCSTIWLIFPKYKWTCAATGDLTGSKRALGSKLPSPLILVTFFGRATCSSPGPSLRVEDPLGLSHPGP